MTPNGTRGERCSGSVTCISIMTLSWGFGLERAKGIEP
jgi:hypothetical protein